MRLKPVLHGQDRICYQVVDQEVTEDLIAWVRDRVDQGYDLVISMQHRVIWVLVPDPLLWDFLTIWGQYVSG